MGRRFLPVLILSVVVLLLGACSNERSEEKMSQKKAANVVAKVNGVGISQNEFKAELEEAKATYAQQGMPVEDLDEKMMNQLEQTILDQMINTELILQKAEKEGTSVKQSEIDATLKKAKSGFENEQQFTEALKKNKLTEDELKEQIKEQLTITNFIDSQIGDIAVSDAEVKSLYEQYKKETEAQKQEPVAFETMKPQLKESAIAQKKNKEAIKYIEEIRKANEKNIDVYM